MPRSTTPFTVRPPRRPTSSADLVLNRRQRERLDWLVARNGAPSLWDGAAPLPEGARLVIVTEAPRGPVAELFVRRLAQDAVVVIPYGENPLFDFLKSKLIDFGTIGTKGADGPHQFWWGGFAWDRLAKPTADHVMPRIVACTTTMDGTDAASRLSRSAEAMGLACDVCEAPSSLVPAGRVDLVIDAWRRSSRPILWVDAAAELNARPCLPAATACDVAIHRWKGWEVSPATLYLSQSPAAGALLWTWRWLAELCPDVWEGHLLDQAWSLVSSQMPLDTVWLPESYHAAASLSCGGEVPVVVHAFAAGLQELAPLPGVSHVRAPRRAGRTGAPEAQLVMDASTGGLPGSITVVMHDVADACAVATAGAIEAAASAFADEDGGFAHLELILSCWGEDTDVPSLEGRDNLLHTTPYDRLAPSSFRDIARASTCGDDDLATAVQAFRPVTAGAGSGAAS